MAPIPPAPAPAARRTVLDEPAIASLAELLRMEDERAIEPSRVEALLGAEPAEVRVRAALAAGRVADRAALPALLAALDDPEPDVRASVAFALGELGDTSAVTLARLAAVLATGSAPAAAEAAHALGKLPAEASFTALATTLRAGDGADEATVQEALLAIWRHPRRDATLPLVLPWTAEPRVTLRRAASYALMRVSAPPAVPRLLELLQDVDAEVRVSAARGLRAGAADSAGRADDARAALRAALEDTHPHVRVTAARALAGFRRAEDAPALLQAVADPDASVRHATLEALAQLPAATVTRPLLSAARDPAAALAARAAALASLARVDSLAARPVLEEWSRAAEWLPRFYAARAHGALGAPGAAEALLRLARDPDGRVQGEAFASLAADTTAPLDALFLEGLAAPDPIVRAGAASGLARRADPAFLSALMQAYDRAQQDTLNDAALAALDALARLAGRGAPVARSFFMRFRPATDPVVRERVARHFGAGAGTWGPARPVRAGRESAWYEQRVRELVAPVLAGAPAPRVVLRTERGDIVLELAAADAPLTVHNFLDLIGTGFYRRATPRWHRVVPAFVLQDGDPRGDGSGGPPRVIRDEINRLRYGRGTLGMALSGPDTGGSQFFLTHAPQPHLDGGYTVFGRVVAGMAVADAIVQDDAILAIEVLP